MTGSPWLVPITALRRSTGNRRVERRSAAASTLGPSPLRVGDTSVPAAAEVEAAADLDAVDGGITVAAVVEAPWVGECRRCLRPLSGTLRSEVREIYRPRAAGERPNDDEETYPLAGELLDLAPLVRDAVLLELPIAPLCAHDCAGLCPTCGAALDEGGCDCPPAGGDPRWAALDPLRAAAGPARPAGPSRPPAGD